MKKLFILLSSSFLLSSAFAADRELIKSCSSLIPMPNELEMGESKTDIFKNADSTLTAVTAQTSEGGTGVFEESATVQEYSVRSGLTTNMEPEALNLAESLIVHALFLTEETDSKGAYNAGLDLRKVRSAKVYTIGEDADLGAAAIIETKDEAGKHLGSFLGGFLVVSCK